MFVILWSITVDSHVKEHILNYMLPILWKLLIVSSSASSHLDIGILNLVLIFGVCFNHFRYILLHDFEVGLLVRVCYLKWSSSPLSNFLWLFKWCLLIWKSRSNLFIYYHSRTHGVLSMKCVHCCFLGFSLVCAMLFVFSVYRKNFLKNIFSYDAHG